MLVINCLTRSSARNLLVEPGRAGSIRGRSEAICGLADINMAEPNPRKTLLSVALMKVLPTSTPAITSRTVEIHAKKRAQKLSEPFKLVVIGGVEPPTSAL
ncbi:hypothetical protein NTGM5_140004 [Candidatus Nitrotoga sp. M5]|nr:hypothetical protein NTGM5_140004 [Candidatus Nitrotoga sp. M5]